MAAKSWGSISALRAARSGAASTKASHGPVLRATCRMSTRSRRRRSRDADDDTRAASSRMRTMKVRIPNPLLSYTHQASVVEARGATLDKLTRDLDRRFPGLRFRIIDEHQCVR